MTVEVVRMVSPVAEAPAPAWPGAVRLVNESGLGVYLFAWVSRDGARREVSWAAGLDGPLAGTTVSGRVVTRTIVAPERFGWRRPRKPADFRAFAQRFADAAESDES
jgi:hypothetical protein